MKNRFFITATGTGVGKTFITAALVRQAKALGQSVVAYKPVITGFDAAKLDESDTGILLRSLDRRILPDVIRHISPWSFAAPLAPSMAARMENRPIDFELLASWSHRVVKGMEDTVLIEGVAGVMTPLNDRHTMRDWIQAAQIPALLVTGNYLGTISHTLTAQAALEQRKVPVRALVVSESENSPAPLDGTVEELARLTKIPVFTVKRRNAGTGWMDVPELSALLA